MRLRRVEPPRAFRAGDVELRHVADVELEPDEVVTFRSASGAEADVTRKSWGYYWTGSLNERLPAHGLEPVFVRGSNGKTFLMLVEAGREREFLGYCAAEKLEPERWLSRHDLAPLYADRTVELERQRQDWNELAELDPYWAILSRPGKRFGGWEKDEFFATGAADAAAVMKRLDRLGRPERRKRALDFGCGFGRMTRGFSAYFEECVGVDISEKMVEGARRLNADKPGLSFVVNGTSDLGQFDDRSFELVHSVIVLQHVPDRPTIESYIREFVRILRPGGIAVFQLPSHIPAIYRLHWKRRLYSGLRRLGIDSAFLYKRLRLVPSAMTYIPERDIVQLLGSVGARALDIERYGASNRSDTGVKSSTYYVGD